MASFAIPEHPRVFTSTPRRVGYLCRWTCEISARAARRKTKGRKTKKKLREPINGLTHLAGGLLAAVGLIVLLAASEGRIDQLVAFGVFGFSLIALYTASTLYHLLPLSPAGVARLRRVDHMTIFVLIAGTYTPFCLLALDGAWRAGLLGLIWGLALCGILLKLLWMDAPRWLSVALYLGMGWAALVAAPALFRAVPPGGITWILAGGVVYSAGALVYGLKRPNLVPGVFGSRRWVFVSMEAPL
ncbi:MAG: hemolysin III family protein [Actinobacteria bacterium]|nr:hemolysin III family protein [Actinomycetota bacterium]